MNYPKLVNYCPYFAGKICERITKKRDAKPAGFV
jgi:hypothetical protein